jgi:uncharacterized protein YjdB
MKYTKHIDYNGDSIMQNLSKIRVKMGDRWTEAMGEYAISKSRHFPAITWRTR